MSESVIKSSPLVSVIINCYNGEKYLREAIDSVLSQTYTNWEVIFWDNQSTDSSATIVKSYSDKRIKYFYAPEHTVLYAARNHALSKAKGDYISFLDCDDWWDKSKLKLQIILFDNANVGLVYSNARLHYQGKGKNKIIFKSLPEGYIYGELLKRYCVVLSTIVVSKEAINLLEKKFDNRFQIIGDLDLILRLSTITVTKCVNEAVVNYRWHGNNLSIKQIDKKIYEVNILIKDLLKNKKIAEHKNFKFLYSLIQDIKIEEFLRNKRRLKVIMELFSYPICFKKLKYILATILPYSVTNYFMKFKT